MDEVVERLTADGYQAPPAAEREQLIAYWQGVKRMRAELDRSALGDSEPSIRYESSRSGDD